MAKKSKRHQGNLKLVSRDKRYGLKEAIKLIKQGKTPKFDETVEVSIQLGVDPKKSDQMVRGVCKLPHGRGTKVRVLVFAKGEKEAEARAAGADFVGAEDLVEKIKGGWLEFDKAIATPDMMPKVGQIARVLGPRGLMPNPKVGTVTTDVAKAVEEVKAGQVEFRVEKAGIIHAPVGKRSFANENLEGNILALWEAIGKLKPANSKGVYLQRMSISSTMGPGIFVDLAGLQAAG